MALQCGIVGLPNVGLSLIHILEKNESGIYDITVNGDEVIEPYQE